MKKFLKDKSGISLIELVVVIAIMSVLVGAIGLGVGLSSTKPATQCAKKLQMAIQKTRVDTMGKKNGRLVVKLEADGTISMTEELNYGTGTAKIDGPVTVGSKGVSIETGSPGSPLTATGFVVEFYRGDGKLYVCTSNYSGISEATRYDALPIVVTKGNRSYSIDIDSLTGRVTLENL